MKISGCVGLLLASTLSFVFVEKLAAQNENEALDAESIVARVNFLEDGQYVSRKLSMELTDRRGKTRVRDTMNYRQYFDDQKKTAFFFLSPANIRDTSFLTWDYTDPLRDDDQWLYLPALGKVRRISAADRGDYFLGTDFTYEDIKLEGKLSLSDYSYNYLEESSSGSIVKLEAIPKSDEIAQELGYSRTVASIDTSNWVVMEVEFWDTKGNPLKQLVASDVRMVNDVWTRHRLTMDNHQTGHRTVLTFSEVDYLTEIDAQVFSRQALTRGH